MRARRGVAGAASPRPVIAFGSERGGPVRIHVLGLRPGAQRILQSGRRRHGRRAQLVAERQPPRDLPPPTRPGRTSTSRSSRRTEPAGTRITSGAAWDEEPAWSPDGKWIAFASDRNGNFDIYVVHPDGTGLRQLTASTLRGHRAVVVAGRLPHRLHEPPRRLPAPLDDERERLGRAEAHQERRLVAAWSPDGKTHRLRQRRRAATTRSTPSAPTARASPS